MIGKKIIRAAAFVLAATMTLTAAPEVSASTWKDTKKQLYVNEVDFTGNLKNVVLTDAITIPKEFEDKFKKDDGTYDKEAYKEWILSDSIDVIHTYIQKYNLEYVKTINGNIKVYKMPDGWSTTGTGYMCLIENCNYNYTGQKLHFSPIDYGEKVILQKGETIALSTNYDFDETQTMKDEKNREVIDVVTGVSDGMVVYSSSNEKVATVSKNGKVKAKKKGKAVITATVTNEKYTANVDASELKYLTCSVKVIVRNKPKKKDSPTYGWTYSKKKTKEGLQKLYEINRGSFNIKELYDILKINGEKVTEWVGAKKTYKQAGKYLMKLFKDYDSGLISRKEANKLGDNIRVYHVNYRFYDDGWVSDNGTNVYGLKDAVYYTMNTRDVVSVGKSKNFIDAIYIDGIRNAGYKKLFKVYYNNKTNKYMNVVKEALLEWETHIEDSDFYLGVYHLENGNYLPLMNKYMHNGTDGSRWAAFFIDPDNGHSIENFTE